MAALVGGALLSGFVNVLFDRLASQEVLDFFRGKKVISTMLDELRVTMLSANALLSDAEAKQFRDQNVKNWLDELKEVIYEVDHVMDKINTADLRRKIEGGDQSGSRASSFFNSVSTLFSAFDNVVKSELEDIIRRLKLVLAQKDFLGLKSEGVDQNRPVQRIIAPLVEGSDVYGRDAEKEAIVKSLLSDDVNGPRISVIPIVGMGGIVKTTLAQLVYKDKRVEEHFDLKAWVTIAEEFDVLRITKEVFEAITSKRCDQANLYQLQEDLQKMLNGKKFLLVLDDVWNEGYKRWDASRSPFESGAHGSKIIVTTRSKIVASNMGNVLIDRLASQEVLDFFRGRKVISRMLDELRVTMLSANALLSDAEAKQFRDQNVKNWLDELKEVINEVGHVMDKINTEALRRKIEGGDQSGIRASGFFKVVKSEIEDIIRRLKLLLAQKDFLGLKSEGVDQMRPAQRIIAPLVEESDVYGRDAEKEAIVKSLLSDDVNGPRISVIPIVGMGGIGKTTLAQLVYKDKRVKEHFDLKAWVTISEEFDVLRIRKEIVEAITSNKCNQANQHQLQVDLRKALNGKKFLLVLDDVWNEDYKRWDALKSPFKSGAHGSKIIVTTRSKIVASKMGNVKCHELQGIDKDDCWKLFARHVFNNNVDSSAPSELQEIGVEIVKKCKGLPLAVKSIAGLLRSTSDPKEWRKIQQSDFWELQFQEDQKHNIPPALLLSYHFLPPPLKRCFVYCSIFPKDYEFHQVDRKKLVLLWMAEGLLQPQNGKRMEDVGEEYLNALISRSFFQLQSAQRMYKSTHFLLMHDLVHDLANVLAGKTNHLSCRKGSDDMTKLEGLSKDKCLRMLSLTESPSLKVSDAIGNLKHLRYLDLSGTDIEEVPSSVCTLYNLQTLLLSNCKKLKHLPKDMSRLINLRHLETKNTPLEEMPPLVCNMKNLQTLSDFVLSEKDGPRIKELKDLQLHGGLCISGLENVDDAGNALEANLKNKDGLEELVLRWNYGETNDTVREKEVLKALQPHTNLKELRIDGYRGTNFPDWVTHQSFSSMVKVTVESCRNCHFSPPFGQLPSLKILEIGSMDSWEKWSSIGADQGVPLFPRLKTLRIMSCKKLNVGLATGCFPSLESVYINYCESMKSVFPVQQIGTEYPSLESIQVYDCASLESFSAMGLPSSLKVLLICRCERLISNRLNWNLQRIYSLQSLDLSGLWGVGDSDSLDSFPEEGLLPTTLNEIDISFFGNLKGLNGEGLQHLTSLRRLYISGCEHLQCLPEEGLPSSLAYLEIRQCPMLRERYTRRTGEDWHKIQHISTIIFDGNEISSRSW